MTDDCGIRDDDYLVRVKAQVMTRDDSTGGWVPMGGGGMSIVGLRKLVITSNGDDIRHEYLIHGQRIADQSVVLNCVLKKDVQYTKANPTFHHWKTEEKRFGLTFQSSADARAFDKGVKRAVEDLLEGDTHILNNGDIEVGDDDVFMTLDLPLKRKDSSSQSASTVSTTTSSPSPQSPALSSIQDPFNGQAGSHGNHTGLPRPHAGSTNHGHEHLHRVTYMPRQTRTSPNTSSSTKSKSSTDSYSLHNDVWVKPDKNGLEKLKSDQGSTTTDEKVDILDNSYVQFKKNERPSVHEYSYPALDSISKTPVASRRDSISSIKNRLEVQPMQPPLPIKSKKKRKVGRKDKKNSGTSHLLSQRSRCVYCNEMFLHDENARGICEDAPDRVADCIEKVSCIWCARGMLYHCMADADGDYGHPCVCDTNDDANCRKWTALTILSLFVPCLWCYWPLTACHRCGIGCGCCGGRHKAHDALGNSS